MSGDDTGPWVDDDDAIEALRAAWREGEPGITEGTRTLEADAMAKVERKAQEWDDDSGDDGETPGQAYLRKMVTGHELTSDEEEAILEVLNRKANEHE